MRSIVCFRDLKQAALYFDRVLPVAFRSMRGTGTDIVFDFPDHIPSRALLSIVFDDSTMGDGERYVAIGKVVDGWDAFRKRVCEYREARQGSSTEDDYLDLHSAYLDNATLEGSGPIRLHFQAYAASLGIRNADVLLPSRAESSKVEIEDPVVSLTGLDLIDVEMASWEQIVEVRKDVEARAQLQRLRVFLTKSYLGKPRSFIEDDIARGLMDYDLARRKHGFNTVVSSLSVLLDSRNLQAAASVGIGAALLGGPWAGISSAVAIEVGKAAIEIAKCRRVMTDWQASHELAYIVQLQSELK